MNTNSPLLPLTTALPVQTAGVTPATSEGDGSALAALFGRLLASAQEQVSSDAAVDAEKVTAPISSEPLGVTTEVEGEGDASTATDDTVASLDVAAALVGQVPLVKPDTAAVESTVPVEEEVRHAKAPPPVQIVTAPESVATVTSAQEVPAPLQGVAVTTNEQESPASLQGVAIVPPVQESPAPLQSVAASTNGQELPVSSQGVAALASTQEPPVSPQGVAALPPVREAPLLSQGVAVAAHEAEPPVSPQGVAVLTHEQKAPVLLRSDVAVLKAPQGPPLSAGSGPQVTSEPPPAAAIVLASVSSEAATETVALPEATVKVVETLPAPKTDRGRVVVTAVREGQAQAAVDETASPGRTLRDLIGDVAGKVRGEASSSESVVTSSGGKPKPEIKVEALASPRTDAAAQVDASKALTSGAEARLPVGDVAQRVEAPRATPPEVPRHPEVVQIRNVGDFAVRSIRYLSGRNEEVITVRLAPRSLGELQLSVRSSAEGVEVLLTTASHAAQEAVKAHVVGLHEALAREGVDVSRVTVQTFTPSDAGTQGSPPRSDSQHASTRSGATSHSRDSSGREPQPRAFSPPRNHAGGLDMFV